MAAEQESLVVLVKLIPVAALVILAVYIPAKLLVQPTEGDHALMTRSVELLAQQIDELMKEPGTFAKRQGVMLTLPKSDDYIILAYDKTGGPISCKHDGISGDKICVASASGNAMKKPVDRVDMCPQGKSCICYFESDELKPDKRDWLNKNVKHCAELSEEAYISGYYPYEIEDSRAVPRSPRFNKKNNQYYRGIVRYDGQQIDSVPAMKRDDNLKKINAYLPFDYEYFVYYIGKGDRSSGVVFMYIEKVSIDSETFILISPLEEELKIRAQKTTCPDASYPDCVGKFWNSAILSRSKDHYREEMHSYCLYNETSNVCEIAHIPLCEPDELITENNPCYCNEQVIHQGYCYVHTVLALPHSPIYKQKFALLFSDCNSYCSWNFYFHNYLTVNDSTKNCTEFGQKLCRADPLKNSCETQESTNAIGETYVTCENKRGFFERLTS